MSQADLLNRLEVAGLRFLEASRRARKPADCDPLYAALEREVKRAWREQRADFLREFRKLRNTFEEARRRGPSQAQINAAWNRAAKRGDQRMARAIDRNDRKAVERGGRSGMKDLQVGPAMGISFDLDHPDAVKWLKQRGVKNVKGISRTSRNRIRSLVVQMAEEGKSYGEIGRAIEDLVDSWAKRGTGAIASRGELIAVTEVGNAYEAGRALVAEDFRKAGLDIDKMWLTAGDERVCTICEPAEADGVIPYQQEFSNGLDMPLGHPGCRCDLSLSAH